MYKICTTCLKEKPLNDFFKVKRDSNIFRTSCKTCYSKKAKENRRTVNGLIRKIYYAQKQSSVNRNHPKPDYTLLELNNWIRSQPVFTTVYKKWVENNYYQELTPSCDRINNNLPYKLNNLKLMTWGENKKNAYLYRISGDKICKAVVGVCKKTNNIIEFVSTREAERCTNAYHGGISISCYDSKKSSGGYVWYYKEDYINKINK